MTTTTATARSPRGRFVRICLSLVYALLVLAPEIARACPNCFGEPGSGETRGLVVASAVLLSVVALVQLVLARFFWRLLRRERTDSLRRDLPQPGRSTGGAPR